MALSGAEAAQKRLQDKEAEINRITDLDVDRTGRMARITSATRMDATRGYTMLKQQGEDVRRIAEMNEQIKEDLEQASGDLNRLRVCWCSPCCAGCYGRKKKKRVGFSTKPEQDAEGGRGGKSSGKQGIKDRPMLQGTYVKSILNDSREDIMNDNLRTVHKNLLELDDVAIAMNQELADQDPYIATLTKDMPEMRDTLLHTTAKAKLAAK